MKRPPLWTENCSNTTVPFGTGLLFVILFAFAFFPSKENFSKTAVSEWLCNSKSKTDVNHTGPNPPSEALGASLCSFTMWYRCHIFVATGKNILQEPHNPTAVYSWITVDISTPGWAMMIALLVVIWLIQWLAYTASSKIVAKHVLGPM